MALTTTSPHSSGSLLWVSLKQWLPIVPNYAVVLWCGQIYTGEWLRPLNLLNFWATLGSTTLEGKCTPVDKKTKTKTWLTPYSIAETFTNRLTINRIQLISAFSMIFFKNIWNNINSTCNELIFWTGLLNLLQIK